MIGVLCEDQSDNACLNNHFDTKLTGELGRKKRRAKSPGPPCLQDGRLHRMQTQALVQVVRNVHREIETAGANTLIAVAQSKWRPIIACRNYPFILYNDSTIARTHAVGA